MQNPLTLKIASEYPDAHGFIMIARDQKEAIKVWWARAEGKCSMQAYISCRLHSCVISHAGNECRKYIRGLLQVKRRSETRRVLHAHRGASSRNVSTNLAETFVIPIMPRQLIWQSTLFARYTRLSSTPRYIIFSSSRHVVHS